jgi:hypothetical protein
MFKSIGTLLIATMLSAIMSGQGPVGSIIVTRDPGGPMKLELGLGISLNKNSNLQREFIAIHDSSLPFEIIGTPGIATLFDRDNRGGSYKYAATVTVKAKEPITAFEIRFIVFDVWGSHVRTLSMSEIADVPAGEVRAYPARWELYRENEAGEHYASIAYVARVRTANSKVVDSDLATIIAEARKFTKKFTAEDLQPRPPSR